MDWQRPRSTLPPGFVLPSGYADVSAQERVGGEWQPGTATPEGTFPSIIGGEFGDFRFGSAEAYNAWVARCTHPRTYETHGCDGVVAWSKIRCARCNKILAVRAQQVWE